ncbi:hypothetical protein OsI_02456 [Oryza sativa Indica Group]|uniref:Uncharacterized protein n=1 Tax=Oryza sativa subsp. indica TaxID=39946 RepID=A2WRH2_ORYSI|nr:hypothetical protein OsI_02456 [Oryza sativa Indica Group]
MGICNKINYGMECQTSRPFIDGPNEAKTTARALPKRRPVKPGFSLPVVQNDRPTYPGHVLFVPHVVEEEDADAGQAASTTTSGLATPPTTAADVGTSAATNSSAAQGSGIVKTETGFLFKRFRPWPAN